MKILITGGSGFIGTNMVEDLISKHVSVLNLDKTAPTLPNHVNFWKCVDILDNQLLEKEILNYDPNIIIHFAAVTDLDGKDIEYYQANIRGTQNIIDIAAKLSNLKKVIFTSSMYVCKPGIIPPDFDTYKPHTLYGESKVAGELLVKAIKDQKYSWIIIRPTSIWGPWFNIPYIDFFKVVYQKKYFDFGRACTKTYGYVANTVYQITKIIESDIVNNKVFYLGDLPAINISEWADEISVLMGKGHIRKIPFLLLKIAAKVGDFITQLGLKFPITSFRLRNMTTNNVLPLDNLYEITGPSPVSRKEGVKNTIEWLKQYKNYQL